MPRKIGKPESVQFSVTLPKETAELMMRLSRSPYFANSRGEVARDLIMERLRELGAPNIAAVLEGPTRKRSFGKKKKARHL